MSGEKSLSRRERNSQALRERGTEIAEKIIVEQGLEALSARSLCMEIGCSVGALYNAYGHIDGVVREVNLRSVALLQEALVAAFQAAPPSPEGRLTALAQAYFDFAMENKERWWALFDYRPSTPPDGRIEENQKTMMEVLKAAADVSEGDGPRLVRLRLLWASVHGLVSLAYRDTISGLDAKDARAYLPVLIASAIETGPLAER